MAVDAALWFILAFTIAWIVLGCLMTAPVRRMHQIPDRRSEHSFDRAA